MVGVLRVAGQTRGHGPSRLENDLTCQAVAQPKSLKSLYDPAKAQFHGTKTRHRKLGALHRAHVQRPKALASPKHECHHLGLQSKGLHA